MFDYDEFIDKEVPLNKRLEALFPERRDIEKRVKFGDTHSDLGLLQMYFFLVNIARHPKGYKNRRLDIELYQTSNRRV